MAIAAHNMLYAFGHTAPLFTCSAQKCCAEMLHGFAWAFIGVYKYKIVGHDKVIPQCSAILVAMVET